MIRSVWNMVPHLITCGMQLCKCESGRLSTPSLSASSTAMLILGSQLWSHFSQVLISPDLTLKCWYWSLDLNCWSHLILTTFISGVDLTLLTQVLISPKSHSRDLTLPLQCCSAPVLQNTKKEAEQAGKSPPRRIQGRRGVMARGCARSRFSRVNVPLYRWEGGGLSPFLGIQGMILKK